MIFSLWWRRTTREKQGPLILIWVLFQIRRDALQDHIKEDVEKHLDLACSKLKQVESVAVFHQINVTLFTWRIPNFDECLQAAKGRKERLVSEAFYTSPHKYKAKLCLNPNGQGAAKNTHLSVYFVIMKGEFDAILPWPFLSEITFTLIDQQDDTTQRENVVRSFKPDPTLMSFAKPVGDENPGRGFGTFVSHEKLQTRRYIVDNTIFFQVKVEVPQIDWPI